MKSEKQDKKQKEKAASSSAHVQLHVSFPSSAHSELDTSLELILLKSGSFHSLSLQSLDDLHFSVQQTLTYDADFRHLQPVQDWGKERLAC